MTEKIIISGAGKCGTSFIMRLLSELCEDTGWSPLRAEMAVEKQHDFPFEWPIEMGSAPDRPRILKHPMMVRWLEDAAVHWNWDVKHVFACVRNPEDIAAHIYQHEKDNPITEIEGYCERTSFLKGANEITEAETREYLRMNAASCTGDLMLQVARMEVPFTLLLFPRTVKDPYYLYAMLAPVLHGVGLYERFEEAFNKIADPSKVHYDS